MSINPPLPSSTLFILVCTLFNCSIQLMILLYVYALMVVFSNDCKLEIICVILFLLYTFNGWYIYFGFGVCYFIGFSYSCFIIYFTFGDCYSIEMLSSFFGSCFFYFCYFYSFCSFFCYFTSGFYYFNRLFYGLSTFLWSITCPTLLQNVYFSCLLLIFGFINSLKYYSTLSW